jgi:PPOX class probable F420-dependent enzyme
VAGDRVPPEFEDLFHGESPAQLATLRADGSPHLTPVWVDLDAEGRVLVNARADRLKAAHMRERPEVAVCVIDARNPYRYVSVSGVVEAIEEQGALEHMDVLARRYLRLRRYPWAAPGERRLLFRIRPTRVLFDRGAVELPEPEI